MKRFTPERMGIIKCIKTAQIKSKHSERKKERKETKPDENP